MDNNDSNQLTGYELSRDWFDFCFDNPELINTTHSALYFFILEHRNRMGQKDKFGFPRRMAMDALAIKSQRTYSQAFEDLAKWGFIKVLQESKNQWSANIIQVVKSKQKGTGALRKATNKHAQKQAEKEETGEICYSKKGESTATAPTTAELEQTECYGKKGESTGQSTSNGIAPIVETKNLKYLNNNNTIVGWRESFEIYLSDLTKEFESIKQDPAWIEKQEKYNPGVDILLSIEKAIDAYWNSEKAWKKKKASRIEQIDWRATLKNAINMNKVYKPRPQAQNQTRPGQIIQPTSQDKKAALIAKFNQPQIQQQPN